MAIDPPEPNTRRWRLPTTWLAGLVVSVACHAALLVVMVPSSPAVDPAPTTDPVIELLVRWPKPPPGPPPPPPMPQPVAAQRPAPPSSPRPPAPPPAGADAASPDVSSGAQSTAQGEPPPTRSLAHRPIPLRLSYADGFAALAAPTPRQRPTSTLPALALAELRSSLAEDLHTLWSGARHEPIDAVAARLAALDLPVLLQTWPKRRAIGDLSDHGVDHLLRTQAAAAEPRTTTLSSSVYVCFAPGREPHICGEQNATAELNQAARRVMDTVGARAPPDIAFRVELHEDLHLEHPSCRALKTSDESPGLGCSVDWDLTARDGFRVKPLGARTKRRVRIEPGVGG